MEALSCEKLRVQLSQRSETYVADETTAEWKSCQFKSMGLVVP